MDGGDAAFCMVRAGHDTFDFPGALRVINDLKAQNSMQHTLLLPGSYRALFSLMGSLRLLENYLRMRSWQGSTMKVAQQGDNCEITKEPFMYFYYILDDVYCPIYFRETMRRSVQH